MGTEAPPGWVSCAAIWTEVGAQPLLGQRKEESGEQVPVEGDIPRGMLSRVAFPSSRWKGVTIIPWVFGGLTLRAVLQVVRKARQSLLSSSMASASRL